MLVDAPLLTGSSASGALPSAGTTLVGSPGGLEVLGADGTRLRGWGWPGIVGWDADGTASDGEGRVRQLLTVRTRSGPLAVLADAGQLCELLATMAGLARVRGTPAPRRTDVSHRGGWTPDRRGSCEHGARRQRGRGRSGVPRSAGVRGRAGTTRAQGGPG
ncbi:MAG: hypothetical protein ACYCU6_11790, partial [Acidimicrobiales bacterium]